MADLSADSWSALTPLAGVIAKKTMRLIKLNQSSFSLVLNSSLVELKFLKKSK